MLADLPDLCVHRVAQFLVVIDLRRQFYHVVHDCLALAATSKATQSIVALALARCIPPAYDMDVDGRRRRLRGCEALADQRLMCCGLRTRLCEHARLQFALHARAITTRRRCLVDALKARGCKLRCDSRMCSEFIEGGHGHTLWATIDHVEEMLFFYSKTVYKRIMLASRCYDIDMPESVRKHRSKVEALRRWRGALAMIPRCMLASYRHDGIKIRLVHRTS